MFDDYNNVFKNNSEESLVLDWEYHRVQRLRPPTPPSELFCFMTDAIKKDMFLFVLAHIKTIYSTNQEILGLKLRIAKVCLSFV